MVHIQNYKDLLAATKFSLYTIISTKVQHKNLVENKEYCKFAWINY
jgi:hypothetical protein